MIQLRLAPPACIVAVGTKWPGTTWLKVIDRIAGSWRGSVVEAEIQDDDPRQTYAPSSGVMTPAPTAAIGPSPPPRTTGVPGRSPVWAAAAGVSPPTTVVEPTTGGSTPGAIPAASSSRVDQSPVVWSNASVPEASDGSVTSVPVSRCTTKSLATQTCRVRAHTSGSWSRTHIIFGSVYVGWMRWPSCG